MNKALIGASALVLATLLATGAQAQDACPNRGELDTQYCDANRDLVADAPSDPKKWRDPSTLVWAYTPVEDPAVYANIFKPFTDHLEKCVGKRTVYYPVQSNAAEIEAMRSGRLHFAGFSTGPTGFAVNLAGAVPFAAKGLGTEVRGYNLLAIVKASSPYQKVSDLKGKKVGNWGFGNEFELFAGITKAGLDPAADVTLVQQNFDMAALLAGDIDAAQAMTYNEYAQVLEAVNPATGELYQPEDFNVINWNDEGTAMLQDAVWANTERLASDEEYQATTVKFLKAVIKGWIYARDNPEDAATIVLKYGPQLGASHQLWQTNEVNKLVWPSPDGIGIINADAWAQTVDVALTAKNLEGSTVITAQPDDGAYTNEYIQKALDELGDLDTTGDAFAPITVTLNEGGK